MSVGDSWDILGELRATIGYIWNCLSIYGMFIRCLIFSGVTNLSMAVAYLQIHLHRGKIIINIDRFGVPNFETTPKESANLICIGTV
jgi:hypothetical protein